MADLIEKPQNREKIFATTLVSIVRWFFPGRTVAGNRAVQLPSPRAAADRIPAGDRQFGGDPGRGGDLGNHRGPSDLSIDLGAPLSYDHPRLIEAVDRVLAGCRSRELSCGIYCATEQSISFWHERRMNIIWSGCATDFITRGYGELSSFVRRLG